MCRYTTVTYPSSSCTSEQDVWTFLLEPQMLLSVQSRIIKHRQVAAACAPVLAR